MSPLFYSDNPTDRPTPPPSHQSLQLGPTKSWDYYKCINFTVLCNVTACRLVSVARFGREVHDYWNRCWKLCQLAPVQHLCLTARPTASRPSRSRFYPLRLASLWVTWVTFLWVTWVTTSDDRYWLKSFIPWIIPGARLSVEEPKRFTPRTSVCYVTRPRHSKREVLAAVTIWRSVWWEHLTIRCRNLQPPFATTVTCPADSSSTFPRGIATPCHRRR